MLLRVRVRFTSVSAVIGEEDVMDWRSRVGLGEYVRVKRVEPDDI